MDKDIVYEKIKYNINSKDNKFKSLLKKVYKKFKEEHYFYEENETIFIEEILDSINLTNEEKIIFYIKSTLIKNLNGMDNFFTQRYLRGAFKKYITENKDKFFNTLKNETLQTMYVNWLKNFNCNIIYDPNIYEEIFELPKFKEIVLEDYDFVCKTSISSDFFNYLPSDFNYLLALSKSCDQDKLIKLYQKYFSNILTLEECKKLANAHLDLNKEKDIMLIDSSKKNMGFLDCLKSITKNPKYYKILKKLSDKTNLCLKDIIKFSNKYNNTEFFYNLCIDDMSFDDEIIKKIKYLSNSEKIINTNNINNLNDISLNELMNSNKEDNAKIRIYGGPGSDYNTLFSSDSNYREIRRINKNGTYKILPISTIQHQKGVDIIYRGIKLLNKNATAIEKSIEAVKKIGSITLIVEGNGCFIVMPCKITDEQKVILLNWIKNSNKEVRIGIIKYNKNTKKKEIVANDNLTKDEIIEFINNFEGKEMSEYEKQANNKK